MDVRLEAPVPSRAIHFLRFRRLVLGFLRLIGTLALVPLGAIGLLALVSLVIGDADPDAIPWVAGLPAALLLGRFLRARKRPRVLYLRAFSHPGVDDVVTLSATGAVGRDYRLITLDDVKLPAIGVPRRAKIRAWITGLVSPPLIAYLAYQLWGSANTTVEQVMDSAFQSGIDNAAPGFGGAVEGVMAALVGAFVVGIIFGLLMFGFFILAASLGAWIGLSQIFSVVSITIAERWKRSRVESREDLEKLKRRLARWRRKRWAPRLHVVSVSDDHWKDVVEELADESLTILMDLSSPSEGLYWEAERFLTDDAHPCALVADLEEFEDWYVTGKAGELEQRFHRLLEGRTVIPFHRDSSGGGKGFQKGLRTAFDRGFLEART